MDAMQEKVYTYEDYCKLDDDRRYEVINGVIYLMSPAPNREHQEILFNLSGIFYSYLKGKKCQAFPAPFDVRLPREGETKATVSSIVQPDIVVVCDKNKLDRRGCFGSPDLIIEILSPSTGKRDMTEKFNLYQEHGVREYWIVDAAHQTIGRFALDKDTGKYLPAEYFDRNDTITPVIFPDFTIKLEEVFPPLDEYEDEQPPSNYQPRQYLSERTHKWAYMKNNHHLTAHPGGFLFALIGGTMCPVRTHRR